MKRSGFYVYLAGISLAFLAVVACVKHAAVADYQAEGLLCVQRATTLAGSDRCRCELERRYVRPQVHCPTFQSVGTAPDSGPTDR